MAEQIITKICRVCKQTKSISEFSKHFVNKDGYRNECKTCCSKYQKEYQKTEYGKTVMKHYAQSEKGRAVQKCHRKTEKYKATQRRYRQSKKYKVTRRHYEQKSEKRRDNRKHYKFRHPNQFKAKNAVNNAIKDGQLPNANSLQCHYCPAQAKQYHHHKGYAPENWLDVVPVCIPCHSKIPKILTKISHGVL